MNVGRADKKNRYNMRAQGRARCGGLGVGGGFHGGGQWVRHRREIGRQEGGTGMTRRYWVRYTGGLTLSDHNATVDDTWVSLFLRHLAAHLIENCGGGSVGSTDCNGYVRLTLSGTFNAKEDAQALKIARKRYTEAIQAAGIEVAALPDAEHPAWRAEELLKTGTVRELESVPA